jgi:hypothetical protein
MCNKFLSVKILKGGDQLTEDAARLGFWKEAPFFDVVEEGSVLNIFLNEINKFRGFYDLVKLP